MMSTQVRRRYGRLSLAALAGVTSMLAVAAPAAAGATIDAVKARGTLRCSVQGPSNPGFGVPDSQGRWNGFNVDWCRAVAIMIFNDPAKAQIVPLTTQTDFPALQ